MRTRFSLLWPRETNEIINSYERQCRNYSGNRNVNFAQGQIVSVTDYRGGKKSWTKARIVSELIPGVTYLVEVTFDITWKRHSNQLREIVEN